LFYRNAECSVGAWGHGIRQDDFVLDVIGDFEDHLKAGKSVREATDALKSKFAADVSADDDDPLFWIALADVQWTYGELEPEVSDRVVADLHSGRSLAPWTENEKGLARRQSALEKFISKIRNPNPRPKKLAKVVVRAPKFRTGDCLSIRLSTGQYSAALVLAADHTHVEHGRNLVGALDYVAETKPTIEVFRDRKWLVLDRNGRRVIDTGWYYTTGFRAVRDRLEVVGNIEILAADPTDSNFYLPWVGLGERAIQAGETSVPNG
jgi:hypothetical protein